MIEAYRIDREDPKSWSLMPIVFWRVYEFCRRTDGETAPRDAVDMIRAWFVLGNDTQMAIWVLIKDGAVVGHCYATTEPYGADHLRYILIRQVNVDKHIYAPDECKLVFDQVLGWAEGMGLDKILMLTFRDEQAMMRKWHFEKYKSLMSLNIKAYKEDMI